MINYNSLCLNEHWNGCYIGENCNNRKSFYPIISLLIQSITSPRDIPSQFLFVRTLSQTCFLYEAEGVRVRDSTSIHTILSINNQYKKNRHYPSF